MKIARLLGVGWTSLVLLACNGQEVKTGTPAKVETEEEKVLYALGLVIAQNTLEPFRRQFSDAEMAVVMQGFADAIKGGVGPGSICTTRIVTGVGLPQLTAIMDAVEGVQGEIPVIADGGIRYSGDLVKALAAGAQSVMMGSMFAGTEESPGESFLMEGRRFKTVRGMGSLSAMQEGSADRYFQDPGTEKHKLVPEGIEARVPYKGPMADSVFQLVGGLQSGMGYCGAANLRELWEKARFVRVTPGGLRESHPHDVTITREAPNYHM